MSTQHDEIFAAGMTVRRQVLGDAHVDRAEAATNDLTRDFQAFITRYAWVRSGRGRGSIAGCAAPSR